MSENKQILDPFKPETFDGLDLGSLVMIGLQISELQAKLAASKKQLNRVLELKQTTSTVLTDDIGDIKIERSAAWYWSARTVHGLKSLEHIFGPSAQFLRDKTVTEVDARPARKAVEAARALLFAQETSDERKKEIQEALDFLDNCGLNREPKFTIKRVKP